MKSLELCDLETYRDEAAGCLDMGSSVVPRSEVRTLIDAFDELLRRHRALLGEVEGENGLRASKEAGWAVAAARHNHILELQESLRNTHSSAAEFVRRDIESEKRIAELEADRDIWKAEARRLAEAACGPRGWEGAT